MVTQRVLLVAAAAALCVAPLKAQAPVLQSASVDVSGALARGATMFIEPAVFGRVTLGLRLGQVSHTEYRGDHERVVDLSARIYPAALSSANPRHPFSMFVGAVVGFHAREGTMSRPYPACVTPGNCPDFPQGELVTTVLYGVVPGLDAGLRLLPTAHMMVDLGGRAMLNTFSDPAGRLATGHITLVPAVTLGVTW